MDVIASVVARQNPPFCVGFAAETKDVVSRPSRSAAASGCHRSSQSRTGPGNDVKKVTLFEDQDAHPLPRMDKLSPARPRLGKLRRGCRAASFVRRIA
jgi:phosphopantothenoylcysteine decarboxylase/phosphopantothenate--cysteine ligase